MWQECQTEGGQRDLRNEDLDTNPSETEDDLMVGGPMT